MGSIAKLIRMIVLTVAFVSQVGLSLAAGQAAEPQTFFHNFVGLSDDEIRDIGEGQGRS